MRITQSIPAQPPRRRGSLLTSGMARLTMSGVLLAMGAPATSADVVIDMPPPPTTTHDSASVAKATAPPPSSRSESASAGPSGLAMSRYVGARQSPRANAQLYPNLWRRYRPYRYGYGGFFGVVHSNWFVCGPFITPCQ